MTGIHLRSAALVALISTAALAGPAAADAPTTATPPADGTWQVRPDSTTTNPGSPPIKNITGSFKVGSGAVTDFTGTTGGPLNSGCNRGVKVTVAGRVPILHFDQDGSDYYYAGGNGKIRPYLPVSIIFQGRGKKAKPHHGHGEIRIYFPGSIGTVGGGAPDWGQVTYSDKVGGICNLQFTPAR